MIYLLVTIHVLVCFFLIVVVLLQSGKAADLAGAFGGMGSQTAFGPRGTATALSKATTVSAILFMVTSITLSIYATRRGGTARSVLDSEKSSTKAPGKTSAPAAPGPAAPGTGSSPVNIQLTPDPSGKTSGETIQVPITPPSGRQKAPAPAGKK
jgi:preprotein translocase subunit SecG